MSGAVMSTSAGWPRASQATMMAVKPYPRDTCAGSSSRWWMPATSPAPASPAAPPDKRHAVHLLTEAHGARHRLALAPYAHLFETLLDGGAPAVVMPDEDLRAGLVGTLLQRLLQLGS